MILLKIIILLLIYILLFAFLLNLIKIFVLIVLLAILFITIYPSTIEKIDKVYHRIKEYFLIVEDNTNNATLVISTDSENINIDSSKLNILFLDVGQADCELILYKGKSILIDAGNVKDGKKIVEGLNNLNISKLDYVFGTHAHEDHVGGMSYIINAFEIEKFFFPQDYSNENTYYTYLMEALKNKNIEICEVQIGDLIYIEDLICEIMSVDNTDPENINLSSIVIELTYNNQKFLFMADAEAQNEMAREWNDVDVLKVGHHGSLSSSTEVFLSQVLPEVAVISVEKDNEYDLPKEQIIKRLQDVGCKIYRTDIDGTIQIVCDGNNCNIIKIEISFDGN